MLAMWKAQMANESRLKMLTKNCREGQATVKRGNAWCVKVGDDPRRGYRCNKAFI